MSSEIKKYVLKESEVPFTEEELKDLDEGCESEGSYHGNDPKVIAEIQAEMERDEEFQKFFKWAEEIDNEEDKLEKADK